MNADFRARLSVLVVAALCCSTSPAQDKETDPDAVKKAAGPDADILAGHSYHGEAFNEGPRQKAYLMGGTGPVKFPATTENETVQKFINQGVGQMYGFWYFEAERSFRQAAALDPDCAMAYWGMAVANINNEKRSKGFIKKAVELKKNVTPREAMYIDAVDAYVKAGSKKKKERSAAYAKALERIYYAHPDDIEAKAFLGLQLWLNRGRGIPISSHLAVNALLNEVLEVEPYHPCHHFRIHLWDYEKPERALDSAARCGQSAPSIAHMWHMPGHIYSRLRRYDDACFQQEASARVDHAQMIRDRLMPDQINNFAHNNEWFIRNLIHVGRAHDALDLAKNMTELPRHPKYNTLSRGSASYGRRRLFEVLDRFERWDDLIALADAPYLEPTDRENEQVKRLRHLGRAYFRKGDVACGEALLAELEQRVEREKKARDEAGEKAAAKAEKDKKKEKEIAKAKTDARKPFDAKVRDAESAANELRGHQEVSRGKFKEGLELWKQAGRVDPVYRARVQAQSGEQQAAEEALRKHIDQHKNEVLPLAALVELLWQANKKKEAGEAFEKLREISGSLDIEEAPFARLAPIAKALSLPDDWRVRKELADDIGNRPELDTLGPFRWHPSPAPSWKLADAEGKMHSLEEYRGKSVIVIFYLGYACLHCAEQLEAFAPKADAFAEAGISLVAVSTDDVDDLKKSHENYENGKFPFPLVSDAPLEVFKRYRAYDDFENQSLHGTFLIDPDGLIRWQDISYEPFTDVDFMLKESRRLLAQEKPQHAPAAITAAKAESAGQP